MISEPLRSKKDVAAVNMMKKMWSFTTKADQSWFLEIFPNSFNSTVFSPLLYVEVAFFIAAPLTYFWKLGKTILKPIVPFENINVVKEAILQSKLGLFHILLTEFSIIYPNFGINPFFISV